MPNWIDTYANASFTILTKTRNAYGRWSYGATGATARCRVAQGNRLVEGVNGNVRALNVICDASTTLDVDDRLILVVDDPKLAKSTQYAIVGIERSATLNSEVKTQKLTCIEAAVTVDSTTALQPPRNFSPSAPLPGDWDRILTWEQDGGDTYTFLEVEYTPPGSMASLELFVGGNESRFDFTRPLWSWRNDVGEHQLAMITSWSERGTEKSALTGAIFLIRWNVV